MEAMPPSRNALTPMIVDVREKERFGSGEGLEKKTRRDGVFQVLRKWEGV